MKNQPVSLSSLKQATSKERLHSYVTEGDKDPIDAVARYIWNLALSQTMQPILHALEITFRNHIIAHSVKFIDESTLRFRDVGCWLDAEPTLLEEAEFKAVDDAKAILFRTKKTLTPGRLVAKLGFGFWVSLCKRPYEQGRASGPALWPTILKTGFPFLPRANRTRSQIYHRVDRVRELRNRISHHEPIWNRDMTRVHSEMLETISWMNLGLAKALGPLSPLPEVVAGGHAAHRPTAERLVKL